MENKENGFNDNIIRPNTDNIIVPNQDLSRTHDNKRPQGDMDLTPFDLPYEDPAVTNPEELASFPTPAEILSKEELDNENETHLINTRKSPVREGRNIISTDNNPDRDGFM
ncbi:hypothetical protein [Flavobacterium subsaxonicum]|uniref:Uncharacterized protein n=1 Tax=Flavobacterium subsaxonicum WB 4.1-42 = DSM 21790 TaxID=1121898 RepID=A0A0A2MRV9_9FLAO|nr:hypothetical protein [Flavobacterium subsaxonicum]KGO94326.1 hypothetical protein Q766_05245 [Flavobacterium subsaxonicum WB 4.1-42 = DSM 21790]